MDITEIKNQIQAVRPHVFGVVDEAVLLTMADGNGEDIFVYNSTHDCMELHATELSPDVSAELVITYELSNAWDTQHPVPLKLAVKQDAVLVPVSVVWFDHDDPESFWNAVDLLCTRANGISSSAQCGG